VKVKVEISCPTNSQGPPKGISRVEINTPQSVDYITSGLCGNTYLNSESLSCSLHYENEMGEMICNDSSEALGKKWKVKNNIDWQLDLQVRISLVELSKQKGYLTTRKENWYWEYGDFRNKKFGPKISKFIFL
jgi:hypothetical protein